MLERTYVKETVEKIGSEVKLQGWAESIRLMGKIAFIELRDKTATVQCVCYMPDFETLDGNSVKETTIESVIEVEGVVKARPDNQINQNSQTGTVEVEVKSYKLLSKAEGLPIQIHAQGQNEAELDTRLDYRWIDLRKSKNLLTFLVWTELERAMIEYWNENGYVEIHSPKILGAPSETGAEVFEVKYFDRTAYLAQSPQFYKQMALASGFEKVFEIGSVFRAENSNTIRHSTEFTGYDAEIAFINSHEDIMNEEEKLLVRAFESVIKKYGEQIEKESGEKLEIPQLPFPRISMAEAKVALSELGIKSEKEGDLSSEEEKALGNYIKQKYNHDFVFVTDYPIDVRPFYHKRHEDNPNLTKSFDLLYKGLEVTTGAQREHRYDVLKRQAEEKGMNLEIINFYLDFFRYGCPPHGGLGMGPSRLIMKMLNLESIRDAMFLFRNPRRVIP